MPRESYSIEIGTSCQAVFDAVHDYERRLEWDSMLSQARLLDGATEAAVGVRSLCVGTWKSAFLALETEYVQFERGQVAAVKLTNRPRWFEHFAATIRHDALGEARSRITYIYSFRARPRFLAPLLEPIMKRMIKREVRGRLRSLRAFLEHDARPRTLPLMLLLAGLILVTASCSAPGTQAGNRVVARVEALAGSPHFPQFDRVLLLESTSETSANVSIGDVNGDGNLDLVLAKGRHWPLVNRVLLGDGRGHILAAYNLGDAADRSYSGRLVNIDGDGDLDVVISNDSPDPKRIYLNDGKGHFHVGSTYGRAEWQTRNASVADLNGDGQPDIIVANRGDNGANYICLNKGKGRFDADCVAFSHESATTITPADFNHDGLIDLAVPHRDGGQSYVYLNSGNATFSNLRRAPFGTPDAAIRMAEVGDLDGDGVLDILAIDERRGVAIHFGQKDGTFSSSIAIDNGKVTPYALAVSDLNGDGRIDIIVGNVEAPSTIYFNDGSGRHYSPVHFGDNKGTVYGFAIADLDRDGLLDVAAARSDAPNVVYFAGPRP